MKILILYCIFHCLYLLSTSRLVRLFYLILTFVRFISIVSIVHFNGLLYSFYTFHKRCLLYVLYSFILTFLIAFYKFFYKFIQQRKFSCLFGMGKKCRVSGCRSNYDRTKKENIATKKIQFTRMFRCFVFHPALKRKKDGYEPFPESTEKNL